MSCLYAAIRFHPVGQGLFCSGDVTFDQKGRPLLRWVYDCGSSTSQHLISQELLRLEVSIGGARPRLDIVVISHFDRDHINCLTSLLKRFNVKVLLLPYLSLAQRLAALYSSESYTPTTLQQFFANPVEYLAEQFSGSIERVIFVPADRDFPEPVEVGISMQDSPQDNDGMSYLISAVDNDANRELAALRSAASSRGRDVPFETHLLRTGTSIRFRGEWEFMPYNDASIRHRLNINFDGHVSALAEQLLTAETTFHRTRILKVIKREYAQHFGTSKNARNRISLFLYMGPLKSSPAYSWQSKFRGLKIPNLVKIIFSRPSSSWSDEQGNCLRLLNNESHQGGFIFTGDGVLATDKDYQHLRNFLGHSRLARASAFQIPHHGSRYNSHPGLAAKLEPNWSINSSDPVNGYKHPHFEVKADFSAFGFLQADDSTGICITTRYEYPQEND